MKKLLFLLFTGLSLPFSFAFGQEQLPEFYNRWRLKTVGVYGNVGAEKLFKPLTFEYFSRNSANNSPQYFMPPPGGGTSQASSREEATSLGLELAWPVGKRLNELMAGLAVQDHGYSLTSTSHYNITPDTVRLHTIMLSDEYLIAQASLDYVFYSKPILKHFRFLWRTGGTFGFSIPSENKFDHIEEYADIEASRAFFNPDGSYASRYSPPYKYYKSTRIESNSRLEAGLRTSVGLELMLDFFQQEIGFSGEYGHGLAGQKILNGGTTDFKLTELKQIQIRYFLR